MPRNADREAIFHPEFRQDLRYWVETDRKVALRVLELLEAVLRDPFAGIGKPEPLKYCTGRLLVSKNYARAQASLSGERA